MLKWGKHPEQKDDEYYQKLLVSSMDSWTLPVASYCLIAMSVKRKGHHDSQLFSSLLQLLCLGFGFFFFIVSYAQDQFSYLHAPKLAKSQTYLFLRHSYLCHSLVPLVLEPQFLSGPNNCLVYTYVCLLDCLSFRTSYGCNVCSHLLVSKE